MLDQYYVLSYGSRMPSITVRSLKVQMGIPGELITVVTSSDNPDLPELDQYCRDQQVNVIVFDREEYLHDPFLSLMDEEAVRTYYPRTSTPARRFISHYEHGNSSGRVFSVFDDDVRFHESNPFRLTGDGFQADIWDTARRALHSPEVWACSFVNQYTWRGSYKRAGVPARMGDPSKWHRTGMLSAQSTWVLSNVECHAWYSPILEDYITTSRYAAHGRYIYVLDEYIHVEAPNLEGSVWGQDDPYDRDTLAYWVAESRLIGGSHSATGSKPFRKYQKYMYPVLDMGQGER